jgi:soluble lytic murein transglycosylase-like protein
MQLMPATVKELGVDDVFDPVRNITGGTRYLSDLLREFDDDVSLAAAAYNAGPGAVRKYGGIPPYKETKEYVRRIKILYRRYRSTET